MEHDQDTKRDTKQIAAPGVAVRYARAAGAAGDMLGALHETGAEEAVARLLDLQVRLLAPELARPELDELLADRLLGFEAAALRLAELVTKEALRLAVVADALAHTPPEDDLAELAASLEAADGVDDARAVLDRELVEAAHAVAVARLAASAALEDASRTGSWVMGRERQWLVRIHGWHRAGDVVRVARADGEVSRVGLKTLVWGDRGSWCLWQADAEAPGAGASGVKS